MEEKPAVVEEEVKQATSTEGEEDNQGEGDEETEEDLLAKDKTLLLELDVDLVEERAHVRP